jgi:hypothetical protein
MPWKESSAVEERLLFVARPIEGEGAELAGRLHAATSHQFWALLRVGAQDLDDAVVGPPRTCQQADKCRFSRGVRAHEANKDHGGRNGRRGLRNARARAPSRQIWALRIKATRRSGDAPGTYVLQQ